MNNKLMVDVPCGRTVGHGENCTVGYLCSSCDEINRLRIKIKEFERQIMLLVATSVDAGENAVLVPMKQWLNVADLVEDSI